MFNLVHKLLGYGELAKNLAFVGSAVAWLLVHPFLWWGLRRNPALGAVLALVFYGASAYILPGGWISALVYSGALVLLAWLLNRRRVAVPAPTNVGRRESLKTMGVLAVGLLLWQQAKAQAKIAWDKIVGLTKEATSQKDLYTVSKNPGVLDPNLKGKPWKLEIGGLVDKPISLSLDEIKALPSVDMVYTMTCISNPVGGDLIGSPRWRGVPLKAVLEKAGVKNEAKWYVWEAADRFVESIAIAEVAPEAMLAYAVENPETGKFDELEPKHGYPLRVFLPGRYGMKQPKWLTKITLADKETTGYWAQRGWSRSATIRAMSRIDVPKNRARIKAGEETFIAGITYAGGRPLERVEVSTDDGKTWEKAELKPPRGKYAWQQWAFAWKPTAGEYTLLARVVEVGERLQEAKEAEPLPDGATGYHTVKVRVG
jgi:DMSO/TMAO reductase YedYZ molybdopterin-dependent catalytic subunit